MVMLVVNSKLVCRNVGVSKSYEACVRSRTSLKQQKIRERVRVWQSLADDVDSGDVDIEAQAELFMKQQASLESGAETVFEPQRVIGEDEVDEETAKKYCREIVESIKILKEKRDMSFQEFKLIVAIEDPRVKENRKLGVESDSGVSREEMVVALQDVVDGKIPKDRVALREMHKELINWPYLTDLELDQSNVDAASPGWREGQARPPMGRDANEKPQSLTDMLPDWMGYGAIYGVSVVPILIGVFVVTLVFFSSLK